MSREMQRWNKVAVKNTCDDGKKKIGRKGAYYVAKLWSEKE